MTTSSSKALVRVLPVAGFLAVVLAVALAAAPNTFRYRGWPRPAPSSAPESLVGLTPRLDVRDPMVGRARIPQVAVAGVSATQSARSAPVRARGVSRKARVHARRTTGTGRQASVAGRPARGEAQRVASRRGRDGGRAEHGKRTRTGKRTVMANEARFARQAAPSYAVRPRPVRRLSVYARLAHQRVGHGRHLGWAGPRAADRAHPGRGVGRHRGRD